jgi:hypothetical protein
VTTAIHLSPDRLRQFLVSRDNYEAVCGIPFKIHDPIRRRDLEKKLKELAVYDRVKQRSRGDPNLEDKITSWRTCTITAVNPFRLKDLRRLECDTYCMFLMCALRLGSDVYSGFFSAGMSSLVLGRQHTAATNIGRPAIRYRAYEPGQGSCP